MSTESVFPFKLEDLKYWVIKRRDGTVTKFVYQDNGYISREGKVDATPYTAPVKPNIHITDNHVSFSKWCAHDPDPSKPLFVTQDGLMTLNVGDAVGIRKMQDKFDFIIDCGDVLTPWTINKRNLVLNGDPEMIQHLKGFVTKPQAEYSAPPYRLLKIDWTDRDMPDLEPGFWSTLNSLLSGKVQINCQGGHGRSGTGFCCLLMVNAPDYTPADAIIHLRALHCPRAIESGIQWNYINEVGLYLGRDGDIARARKVSNFKDAFAQSEKPTAIRIKNLLKA